MSFSTPKGYGLRRLEQRREKFVAFQSSLEYLESIKMLRGKADEVREEAAGYPHASHVCMAFRGTPIPNNESIACE